MLGCLHSLISPFLKFKLAFSGLQIITTVFHTGYILHRLHFLVAVSYGLHCLMIFHSMSYPIPLSLKFHTWLLSSVTDPFDMLLNEDLWLLYLVLNAFSVNLMYMSGGLLSFVVTVAWYTIDGVLQAPSSHVGSCWDPCSCTS